MFAFDRSAFAVLIPLALLLAVVLMSNGGSVSAAPDIAQIEARTATGGGGVQVAAEPRNPQGAEPRDQTVAANLASR